ncbi:LysR family transcriptional regulator [Sorangium sp. So ce1097]|uniref:LysR family transcriptional regulator n=1 Tax=Sorangium sp. So ce1097 TaxID=3133330 RepID=UPI003F61F2F3
MEIHQVRYFLAITETRSFTRAAERCAVSQPALTAAIKKLEEELGGALLLRERGGAKLTALGQHVLPRFQRLHDETQAVQVIADNHRRLKQVPLRVGVLCTVGPARLARSLAAFRGEAPGVELEVSVAMQAEILRRLEEAEVDVIVTNLGDAVPEWCVVSPLYDERYVVVLPPGHRLEARDALRLEDLGGEPYLDRLACEMRERVTAACAARDVALYAAYRTDREDWVQSLVHAGLGFAFMPEHSVLLSEASQRPLVDPPIQRTIALVRSGDRTPTPAVQLFWDTLLARSARPRPKAGGARPPKGPPGGGATASRR